MEFDMSKEKDKEKDKITGKNDASKYIELEPSMDDYSYVHEEILNERTALTLAQRRKRAMTMRRYKNKMAVARERLANRRASEDKLKTRARKKALGALKKRLMGGREYRELSPAEKYAIDKRAERLPDTLVARIAQKLLPKVRQAETERLRSRTMHRNESFDEAFESFLAEGRFHNLLNKDETVKTDKRFKIYRPKKNSFYEEVLDLEESVNDFISEMELDPADREEGTDSLVRSLKRDTPGQNINEMTLPSKEDTMGIQRRSMPQIKGEDVPHFLKYLKTKGINVSHKEVHPNDLKATQVHFNQDKINTLIDKLKSKTLEDHPIITSNDDCVIDGHHRWLAHVNTDSQGIKAAQIDLPHKEVISAMKDYPRSFTKNLSEGVTADDYITPVQMKAFEKIVDQLFSKFDIDFKFTSHFGDRMVDKRNVPLVTLKDLAATIKKLYEKVKKDGKTISKFVDAEAVIKDLQNDLNIPIAVEYDRKNDEVDVVLKTVMRKKKFLTPDPEIKV